VPQRKPPRSDQPENFSAAYFLRASEMRKRAAICYVRSTASAIWLPRSFSIPRSILTNTDDPSVAMKCSLNLPNVSKSTVGVPWGSYTKTGVCSSTIFMSNRWRCGLGPQAWTNA
jgi:hypothetical protein